MFKSFLPILKGLMRQSLSIISGGLVAFGVLNDAQSVEIVGYVSGLISLVQSVTSTSKETFVQQFQGFVRHIITFVAGLGFVKGFWSSEMFIEIVSLLSAFVGFVWSSAAKVKSDTPILK